MGPVKTKARGERAFWLALETGAYLSEGEWDFLHLFALFTRFIRLSSTLVSEHKDLLNLILLNVYLSFRSLKAVHLAFHSE